MMDTSVELLVHLLGGFWAVRRRINETAPGIYRSLLLNIYYIHLRNHGSFIGHSAVFHGVPLFPHGMKGVFVAGGSTIGENCVIFHHVTLGGNPLPNSKAAGFPTIGANCYLGAGATVIGQVSIGDNCRLGANCTVTSDVPANSTVVSPPARVIRHAEPIQNRYYKWSPDGPVYYEDGRWLLERDERILERLRHKV